LKRNEIIEILDQAKAEDPEWRGAIIEIIGMFYEESVCFQKHLENLKRMSCIKGPAILPAVTRTSIHSTQYKNHHELKSYKLSLSI
jgi:hypothetical protein